MIYSAVSWSAGGEPIEVASRRQLFVDRHLIDTVADVRLGRRGPVLGRFIAAPGIHAPSHFLNYQLVSLTAGKSRFAFSHLVAWAGYSGENS